MSWPVKEAYVFSSHLHFLAGACSVLLELFSNRKALAVAPLLAKYSDILSFIDRPSDPTGVCLGHLGPETHGSTDPHTSRHFVDDCAGTRRCARSVPLGFRC